MAIEIPQQCYFNGNFYQCVTDAAPGESPDTAPDKWSLVQFPARWRWVLAKLTYANLLELDGQKDKATMERAAAIDDDRRGLDRMIRNEATNERFLERPQVTLR
jgi:hypothetical protein